MKKQKGYLVAEFPNFPGVRIPLLSNEECKERGIEPGKFPPFSTWTPEQQTAGQKLAEILCEMAVSQAYRSMTNQLELMKQEGCDKPDREKEAARRVQRQLEAGTWNPPAREDTYGLHREVGWAVASFLKERDASGSAGRSVARKKTRAPASGAEGAGRAGRRRK